MVPLPMYSLSLSVNFRQLDFLGILGLLDKLTGLDLREFDDAIVFKVALMVKKYLDAKPIKY